MSSGETENTGRCNPPVDQRVSVGFLTDVLKIARSVLANDLPESSDPTTLLPSSLDKTRMDLQHLLNCAETAVDGCSSRLTGAIVNLVFGGNLTDGTRSYFANSSPWNRLVRKNNDQVVDVIATFVKLFEVSTTIPSKGILSGILVEFFIH